jgi:hypothetical protein
MGDVLPRLQRTILRLIVWRLRSSIPKYTGKADPQIRNGVKAPKREYSNGTRTSGRALFSLG